jgi:hypothetical protein
MPPKKGKVVKKKEPRISEEEDIHQIDVQYNPDIVSNLLFDLSSQVDSKCMQIQKDAEFMITSIQQAFHLELIKLPNQVKQMSIKRFKEEFGDSLEAVTREAINGPKQSINPSLNNKSNRSANANKAFQTPSHSKFGNQLSQSSLRYPKEGETILSINGSPLGAFTTVKKPQKESHNNFVPPTPGVFVPLKSGEIIDIESADIDNMTEESKQDAMVQMQAVMDNMQALMLKLSQPTSY